jgi:hypothetical protein
MQCLKLPPKKTEDIPSILADEDERDDDDDSS